MTTTNGWPDPARPGVPLNPEKEGLHWLQYENDGYVKVSAFLWERDGYWVKSRHVHYSEWPGRCTYLGLVLTPDEVQNLREADAVKRFDAEQKLLCRDNLIEELVAIGSREQARREALQKRVAELETALAALQRDASQEIATDEIVRRLQHLGDWQAADRIEAQAAKITRLRAEVTTARREGMAEAAKIADSCAADWTKSARGKFIETKWDYESRADAGEEIAAAIRAAAGEGKP